jgi:hypothetical protein
MVVKAYRPNHSTDTRNRRMEYYVYQILYNGSRIEFRELNLSL